MSAPLRLPIGVHDGVPEAAYHQDCAADGPSLSSSIAKLLLDATPRHAWMAHPRLNPLFEPKVDSKFDLGTVAHKLILGRGADIHVVDAETWATKAAKEQRDAARAAGMTPILRHQYVEACAMTEAVIQRLYDIPEAVSLVDSAGLGFAERVMIWRDLGGALCRARIDFQQQSLTDLFDLKTTGVPLDDRSLENWVQSIGHDVQCGLYLRGAAALWPELAGRFRWRWIIVEDSEPFEVRVFEPTGELLDLADRKAALSIEKWRRCIEADLWPGYEPIVSRLGAPAWALDRQMAREMIDEDALNMVVRAL